MKVIYWSDYACPFCYIGEEILKRAFQELGTDEKLELVMKSFELDPEASRKVTSSTPERFAKKYGMTLSQAQSRINAISEMGHSAGIDFNYASTRYTNTLDAHRLTKLAQDKYNLETAEKLSNELYAAYFTENLELANPDVLTKAGLEAGLKAADIEAILSSNMYEHEVREDENEAYSRGVHAVPFFVIGEKYNIPGALPLEDMKEVLRKGLKVKAMSCGPEGCSL